MRVSEKRRGVSEITGILIMLATVISLGVLFYTSASAGMRSLSENFAAKMTGEQSQASEKFAIEAVDFSSTSAGTLALDGSATGCFGATTQTAPCTSSTTTGSASLTTADTNDIIVVVITNEDAPNAAIRTVSSVTATGLTFAPRSTVVLGTPTYQEGEVWWALAAAKLSAVAITVTLSGATDDAAIVAFGVNGANTASPWDTNSLLPATTTGAAGLAPYLNGFSTSNPDDMIIGVQGNGDSTAVGATTETQGTGMTLISNVNNAGGTNDEDAAAEYKLVTATQYEAGAIFGTATAAGDAWMMIVDAIRAAPSTPTGADVYVQNYGTVATTLEAVYVTDVTTDTFVGQFSLTTAQGTLDAASTLHISSTIIAFTGAAYNTYLFTVTSQLGNSAVYTEEAE